MCAHATHANDHDNTHAYRQHDRRGTAAGNDAIVAADDADDDDLSAHLRRISTVSTMQMRWQLAAAAAAQRKQFARKRRPIMRTI